MDVLKEDTRKSDDSAYWIFFLRQLFSCSAVTLHFFMYGLYMGAPTIIIPQMRKEFNSTDVVSPEAASWLSSAAVYSSIPWTIILPSLAYRFGRKYLLVLVTLNVLMGNIVFCLSTSVTELIISQALQGMLVASVPTITIMVLSEYTSPKYRGILLTVKSATFYWGVWVSNAIGTFFHWKIIGIVVFICCTCNLTPLFCCESPYWLATKGRFEECATAHRWLKGTDKDSEEELRKLILSQKDLLNTKAESDGRVKYSSYIKLLKILRYKSFYKPLLYSTLLVCLYNCSGKMVYTVYAIDIVKNVTSSEKFAYRGMLILDGVTVFGMYVGCALTKSVSRRVQLLVLSAIGIGFLYVLSIYLYMVSLNILTENKYVSLLLLTGFSISISCGPIIIIPCSTAELSPLRFRSYFLCCTSLLSNILLAMTLKIFPFIFNVCGSHGAFLFYAITASLFIFILYKCLPETKGMTIQDIQERILEGDDRCAANEIELLPKNQL